MPAMAAARPTDDFDMAKLQKSLRQRQRHSIRNQHHIAKLSPAEIRSLNHSALASTTDSQTSTKGTSPAASRRSTTTTPPASPDQGKTLDHRNSISRNSIINVPTPPHTPNGHRRSSQSSTHSQHHVQSNGVIHAPRPRGNAQAAFMVSNGVSSRPSSSGSSTYRGLPTYRGPEVTRTGSMNMLQRPSPTIVANPLSNFSRPRQSLFSSSPERCRHDYQELGGDRAYSFQSGRADSLPNVSAPSSRPASPPRVTDSPVSLLINETEKFPVLDPNDPHNQPKDLSEDEEIQNQSPPQVDDPPKDQPPDRPASPASKPREAAQAESPKKDKQKRFTISAALFGGDKSASSDNQEKTGKLKKTRRRTLSSTKSDEVQQTSAVPETAASPIGENGANKSGLETEDFSTHPAVRPLSLVIPTETKGKEKEIHSPPVYARCACCGKVKKPPGYTNELSPVLENENLRTNFSFEIERTADSTGRRSSDASRGKFTPIIPMVLSATETRQASIEPYTTSTSPVTSPRQSLTSSPRRPKKHLDPPKFVRFASLHGRRDADSTVIAEEDENEFNESKPLMGGQSENEIHAVHTRDFADITQVAKTQPVVDNQTDRAEPQASIHAQTTTNDETAVPERPSDAGSDNDAFITPNRGTSPAVKSVTIGSQELKATQPLDREKSFRGLPEPNMGIDFKDFVIPSGVLSGVDHNAGGSLSNGNKERKWTAEVMAV